MQISQSQRPTILLVDDEPQITQSLRTSMRKLPWNVLTAEDGREALDILSENKISVIVSDERMPGMAGAELLSRVKDLDPDTVRIMLSGQATLEAAVQAINSADLYRFLMKPCPPEEVISTIEAGLELRKEQMAFRTWHLEHGAIERSDRERLFDTALEQLQVVFQPIFSARTKQFYLYEALMRCSHPQLNSPGLLLAAAEDLGRSADLTMRLLELVAAEVPTIAPETSLFINLEVDQLFEPRLLGPSCSLHAHANRVVVEITERSPITDEDRLHARIAELRSFGYRIAMDDLGAGYAGLTSFALLSPDVVKLDMDLVRDIHLSPTKQRILGAMASACIDLDIDCVAEGIECQEEAAEVTRLGCSLLQGYHLGRPLAASEFPQQRAA